tara:strand:- start:146 stop:619 length:474 start_codon:yes stop_codon:yes gene_type:complete
VDKCRDLGGYIEKRMELDAPFGLSELGPPEHAQAKVYGRGIKGIDLSLYHKIVTGAFSAGNIDQAIGKLLKDLAVPIFIGFGEVAPGNAFPKPEVVGLRAVGLNDSNQITEAVPGRQLAKDHTEKLVPASKMPDVSVAIMFGHHAVKNTPWQKFRQL